MPIQSWALLATVLLAFAGYFATYLNNLLLARRRERLELINQRLNDFYGPLYIVTNVGSAAYKGLVRKLGREGDPELKKPLSEKEYVEWRIWVTNVFMPLNESLERLLLQHAHLLIEQEMPDCMLDFVTHVSAYRAVIAKWSAGDYTEWDSLIDFPEDLQGYAEKTYRRLKSEQLSLIGKLQHEERPSRPGSALSKKAGPPANPGPAADG